MTHICILLPYHWGAARGGAEYQAHLLAQYMHLNSEYRVTYLARYAPVPLYGWGYEIVKFAGPILPGALRWGRSMDSFSLFRALTAINPDIVLNMVASAYTGVAAHYCRSRSKVFCWYLASDRDIERPPNVGIDSPARKIDEQLFYYGARHADLIVAQTQQQADRMQVTLGRKADLVLGNFVPDPGPPGTKNSRFTVAWIANIKQLKRPDLFIALAERVGRVRDMDFRMAGSLAEPHLEPMVREAEQTIPNFRYLGGLSQDEVNAELGAAHVFINTSDYEGFPNVFIQAWLQKVPVYTLHVDPDGVMESNGIGRRTNSLDALAEHLINAYDRRESLASQGEAARRHALAAHSMSNIDALERLLTGYRKQT